MFNLNIGFYICDTLGFLRVMYFVRLALNLIRYIVPIILIAMLVKDLLMNVINPNEKDGMKKITNRLIAAVVVFLIPTVVNLIMNFINLIFENESTTNYTVSQCYTNATKNCIDKIDNYLECEGNLSDAEKKLCRTYRKCNSYKLDSNCNITTEENDYNCKQYNEKTEYSTYKN